MTQPTKLLITVDLDTGPFSLLHASQLLSQLAAKIAAGTMSDGLLSLDNTSLAYDFVTDANDIAISWHIDDVKEIRPDLTDDQAREVLQQVEDRHDAGIGITWDVLAIHADDLFPKESEAQEA